MSKKSKAPIELTKKQYEKELLRLQIELVKMQEWIVERGLRVAVMAAPPSYPPSATARCRRAATGKH